MLAKRVASAGSAGLLAVVLASAPSIGQEPDGRATFVATCSGCHGASGEGGYGPPLVSNAFVANAENMVPRIVRGGELMPPFGHLTDAEIATIINFVRTDLNDYSDMVDAAFVARLRP
jgi:mono/diheme cytochrome c family protein